MTRFIVIFGCLTEFFFVFIFCQKALTNSCESQLIDDKIDAKFVDFNEKLTENLKFSSLPWKFRTENQRLLIDFNNSKVIKSIFLRGSITAYNVSYRFDDGSDWIPIFDQNGFAKVFRSTDQGIKTDIDFPLVARQLIVSPMLGTNFLNNFDIKIVGCKFDSGCYRFDAIDRCLEYDLQQRGFVISINNHLSFRLKTYQSDGILMSSIGNQYDLILILIRRGRVEIFIDFGSRIPSQVIGYQSINDGNWHRIDMIHDESNIYLFVDGMKINETKSFGANYRLDLDRKIYIGCAPLVRPLLNFVGGMKNFTGFLSNFTLTGRNLLDSKSSKSSEFVSPIDKCSGMVPDSITFMDASSWIDKIDLPIKSDLSIAFWMRTFVKNATILSTKPSDSRISDIFLEIREGNLNLVLSGLGDPIYVRSAVDVADMSWHKVEINVTSNYCSLKINFDSRVHRMEANFSFKTSKKIHFGGAGFVGCLRKMELKGISRRFMEFDPHSAISWKGCNFRDNCHPNPCSNGGTCSSKFGGFQCTCTSEHYGITCQAVNLPKSCREFFEFVDNSTRNESVLLDMDGNGALLPIRVTCLRDAAVSEHQSVYTLVDHDQPLPSEIKGFTGRGEGHIVLNYDAHRATLLELISRHNACSQEVIFECFGGTRLMNSPSISGPPTWWTGFSAVHIHSWGAADPGSRSCECALTGTCLSGKNCNCDSGQDTFDAGNVTFKEHLPVRRIFVGDTNFFGKYARITVGRLICKDSVFDRTVTITKLGGYLTLNESLKKSKNEFGVEISLEFLTNLKSFTLLTNHPMESFDFLSLYYTDGNLILEIVASGSILILNQSSIDLGDNRWHSVYAVVSNLDAYLVVDHVITKASRSSGIILSPILGAQWRLGASMEVGSIFSGAFRSVTINGRIFDLLSLITDKKDGAVEAGLIRKCETNRCLNGGRCLEFYTHFECDCSSTPFEGPTCNRDIAYDLFETQLGPYSVSSIQSMSLFRIGFSVRSKKSINLIRSYVDEERKSAIFSLIFTSKGDMQMIFVDGKKNFIFNDSRFEFNDQSFYDVSLKISKNIIVWQVGRYKPLEFSLQNAEKFTRGISFWIVGDRDFVGCVSKMQIGDDLYPLKEISWPAPEGIRRGFCSSTPEDATDLVRDTFVVPGGFERVVPKLVIRPVDKKDRSFLVGVCSAVAIFCALLFCCCAYRCWRTRPSGEYKTHEDTLIYMTGDSSQQALVPSSRVQSPRREWFI